MNEQRLGTESPVHQLDYGSFNQDVQQDITAGSNTASASQNPHQVSNISVPFKNGKLDLSGIPNLENAKIKFDAKQNVKVKNVMKEEAKYGDKYAKKKTATKGVLTVSIILQNISQLKSIIKAGADNSENFWILVFLLPLSLIVQLVGSALMIHLARMKSESNEHIKKAYSVNGWIFYISSFAGLLNIVIAALFLSQ